MASQVNELNIIRQSLYDLESQHGKIRQHYEEEIARVRANTEVAAARSGLPTGIASLGASGSGNSGAGGQVVGPGGPPSAGGAGSGGPLGIGGANQIAMPSGSGYGDPYYLREREREREQRERERERERMGDRERERDRGGDPRERERERDRERERELRERERERERERGDPRDLRDRNLIEREQRDLRERDLRERERERERERLSDQRDPKRLKSERIKTDRPDHFSPSIAPGPGAHSHLGPGGSGPTPKLPPPPSSQGPAGAAAAAAAAAGGMGPGLPPPPSLHGGAPGYGTTGPGGSSHGGDNSNSNNSLGLIPLSTSGPSSSSGIPPGPGSALGPVGGGSGLPLTAATTTGSTATSFPEEFDVHNISPEFKKEGSDWFAIFNPKVKRVLDVSLVHTLMHERCVCDFFFCVGSKTDRAL